MKNLFFALSVGTFLLTSPVLADEDVSFKMMQVTCVPDEIGVNVLKSELGRVPYAAAIDTNQTVLMLFKNPNDDTITVSFRLENSSELCILFNGNQWSTVKKDDR